MTSERDLTVMLVANLIAAHDPCYKEAGGHDPWHEDAAGSVVGTVLRAVAAAPLPPVGDGGMPLTSKLAAGLQEAIGSEVNIRIVGTPTDSLREALEELRPLMERAVPGARLDDVRFREACVNFVRLALSRGPGAGHSSLAPVSPEGVENRIITGLRQAVAGEIGRVHVRAPVAESVREPADDPIRNHDAEPSEQPDGGA